MAKESLIERYRQYLPIAREVIPLSLGEGNTPLLPLINLPKKLGMNLKIFVKFEGMNPTGSFKDRGMTVAISQAVFEKARAVLCASTGNTAAAAAAYAARAGLPCLVLVPAGKIALGKLAQAMMHGARVILIEGNFDLAMEHVKKLSQDYPLCLVNSVNPYRIQGQKTIAFEVVDEIQEAPAYHCLPVGNAGNITATWLGYSEYFKIKKINRLPKMLGYQASQAAPIFYNKIITHPETVATAIRIGHPQSWQAALTATQQSQGWINICSDEEILLAQKYLASDEGIFCEPSSAISLAGLINDYRLGKLVDNSNVVCTLTGHGLKDPEIAIKQSNQPLALSGDYTQIARVVAEFILT